MDKNNGIKDAKEKLESVSGDYEIRRIAELKEKAIRDEIAAKEYAMETGMAEGLKKGLEQGLEQVLEQGLERGLKQGLERGRKEGIEITAKNMLDLGVEVEIISKATGLSREEILKIK